MNTKWFKKKFEIKNSLLVSAGSSWIIKSDLIKLFKKNILNLHQSALPSLRGAVASYIKLFEIRALQTCLHVVTDKLDKGDIVFYKDIFISKEIDSPLKLVIFYKKIIVNCLKIF